MRRKKIAWLFFLLIPVLIAVGVWGLHNRQYALISLLVALVSCVPLLLQFECRRNTSRELVILAVMVALSAVGRFIFAWVPGFKPVTAITVIAALYLGKEAGFVVGSLSAVLSNFYFGQGPWTPFQMFAWGILGFLAGAAARPLREKKVWLAAYGIFSGVFFSLLMDIWSVLWIDGTFVWGRYLATLLSALPFTVEYAVSNVVFLLLLARPIGEKLERIKTKYGLFPEAA